METVTLDAVLDVVSTVGKELQPLRGLRAPDSADETRADLPGVPFWGTITYRWRKPFFLD